MAKTGRPEKVTDDEIIDQRARGNGSAKSDAKALGLTTRALRLRERAIPYLPPRRRGRPRNP